MITGDLDTVELFLEVEDAFGVKIPEEEYMEIKTTNDLVDVVTKLCGADSRVGEPCLTARAFFALRSKLLDLVPLQRQEIRASSSLESLIPKKERRRVWQALREDGMDLPRLGMSRTALILIFMAASAATICWLSHFGQQYGNRLWTTPLWLSGALVFVGVALMAKSLHTPWATRIPAPYHTVRDVATHLACLDVSGRSSALLSRDEVAHNIRMIISYQLGIPLEGFADSKEIETLI